MGRNLQSRTKRMRRIGEKIISHGEKAFSRRPYPPGQHGPKGTGRASEYAIRLREKQKAQLTYGMLERQFRRYVRSSKRIEGDTSANLIAMLEQRLDNVVFRAGFAASREAARQLIRHGHVRVNGKRVDIPSYAVDLQRIVSLAADGRRTTFAEGVRKYLENYTAPAWISVDAPKLTATVQAKPTIEDVGTGINLQLIVEFYSR